MTDNGKRSTRAQHARRELVALATYFDARLSDRMKRDQEVRSSLEEGRVDHAASLLTDAILPAVLEYLEQVREDTLAAVVSVAARMQKDA